MKKRGNPKLKKIKKSKKKEGSKRKINEMKKIVEKIKLKRKNNKKISKKFNEKEDKKREAKKVFKKEQKIPRKKTIKKQNIKDNKPKKNFFENLKESIFGDKKKELKNIDKQPKAKIKSKEIIKKLNKKGELNLRVEENLIGKKDDPKLKKIVKNLKEEISEKQLRKKIEVEKNKQKIKGKEKFIKTGINGFDSLFEKDEGIPQGSAVLVEGGPGSGKTLFCLTTLKNLCSQGKKGLYMSFEEPEERLIEHMEGFGWDAKTWVKKGLLRVKRFDSIDVSRSVEALLSAAKKELLIEIDPVFFPEDFDPDFIVIDSLTSISSAFSGQESRFRVYMEQLFRYLEANKITNFLIREVSSPSHIGTTFKEQGEAVSFLSDGIIVIYNVIYDSGERGSAIEILKMRGTNFKRRIVELKIIDKKGVEVNSNKILKKDKKNNFLLT